MCTVRLFRGDAMEEEGWYVDPYGVHEARWVSAGTPTALVRDGDVESQDPPPNTTYLGALEELEEESIPEGGGDLRRADSVESKSFDPEAAGAAVWDTFGSSSGGD
jgi:hypothetical protein